MSTTPPSESRRPRAVRYTLAGLSVVAALMSLAYALGPESTQITSVTVEEAKSHGTHVARLVQTSGPPVVGADSKVERLWHFEGRFTPRRVLDGGYTTSVRPDWSRIGSRRVDFYVQTADTVEENCCLVVTKTMPTAAWLVVPNADSSRRDTVHLRLVP